MDDWLATIRTEFRESEHSQILHRPTRALLGVTPAAEQALAELKIETVFDLATSSVFAAAVTLTVGGTDLRSALARYGVPSSDLVRDSVTAGKPLAELPFLPISALQGVPPGKAKAIADALDTGTVRDFALYPPYRAATTLLRRLYFPESDPLFDPERPADLVPSTGEYPTERVQYQTVLMDVSPDSTAGLMEVTSKAFAPIDLTALAAGDAGFRKVAFGALLTYSQSWYSQGVTLGQLLHSVALAPGESTRIAVVDWTRRSRAGETEIISEEDELSNQTAHNRAISEVTNAVATEAQNGFSHSSTFGSSTEMGMSHAVDVSGPLGGLLGGVGASSGQSVSNATTVGTADSYSSSFGQRTVGSSMGQQIADRTHQNAHSSRTRRASVVKEVAQSEHESVSTRVIANYNHMHALTVQYYEVVQIHRVDLTLAKAERVIFIPVRLLDFADERLIRRFRGALWRAALTTAVRTALEDLDVIELRPDPKQSYASLGKSVEDFVTFAQPGRSAELLTARGLEAYVSEAVAREVAKATGGAPDPKAATKTDAITVDTGAAATGKAGALAGRSNRAAVLRTARQQATEALWNTDQAARMSSLLGNATLRSDSTSLYLPTDVSIERAFVDAGATVIAAFTLRSGAVDTTVSATDPISLSDVTRIDLRGASPEGDIQAKLVLTLNRNGVRFPVELPTVTIPQGRRTDTPLVTVRANAIDVNLVRHFADNRLWYSQAVLRSLDGAQLALLLSGLSIDIETEGAGRKPRTERVPIAQIIDPIPIRYVGNYLAFRMSVDRAYDLRWKAWLDDHDVVVGKLVNQDIVPLGTGGVFAEAVLGRSNSAEKLDITRFWDWQDSPIPLQPTEIAAIGTGSRATAEDTSPGQLSAPIINVTSPTTLPDPAGTAAILQAIQNGNMFRDMSGLAATIGLVQAGVAQTMAGATAAGQQAGENMNNLLRATTERQRIGAEMVTDLARTAASVYTGGAIPAGGGMSKGGGGGGGSSQQGAKINYFDKMANPGSAAGSPAGGAGAGGTTPQGGGPPAVGGAGAGGAGGGQQTTYSQNPAALEAVWGDTRSASDTAEGIMRTAAETVANAKPRDTGKALVARRAWPILDPGAVLPRIEELRKNPELLDVAKPAEFERFANSLYASGVGFLGNLKVSPSVEVRNLDYGEMAVMRSRPMPPQADWMLMVALRNSESWLTEVEGLEPDAALLLASTEFDRFYSATGWYSSVEFTDRNPADVRNLPSPTVNRRAVTIWLRTKAQYIGLTGPVMMLSIKTKPRFDTAKDRVEVDYWASGHSATWVDQISTFESEYLGATVATLA
jgi:hypothetical protein